MWYGMCWTYSSFIIYNSVLYIYIYVYFNKVNYLQRQRLLTLSRKKLCTSANRHLKSFFSILEENEKKGLKCHFNFTNEINLTKLYIIKLIVTCKFSYFTYFTHMKHFNRWNVSAECGIILWNFLPSSSRHDINEYK